MSTSADDIRYVGTLQSLTTLILEGQYRFYVVANLPPSPQLFQPLINCPRLHTLSILNYYSSVELQCLPLLPALAHLTLSSGSHLSNAGYEVICACRSLHSFTLVIDHDDPQFVTTPSRLSRIIECPLLQTFDCQLFDQQYEHYNFVTAQQRTAYNKVQQQLKQRTQKQQKKQKQPQRQQQQ